MKCYLVGGAVRDHLLKLPIQERDWVVLEETPESMIRQGFRPVGKDFPVFLHPSSHEEYALARTERKTAPGYKGFSVHAAPDVTLEQDLMRRDLTINAMAMTLDGTLIDPFGGRRDLEQRIFRHISPAFSEDPVRILRVARFAARYARLEFNIAAETLALMQQMVDSGEVDYLVPERVWGELVKALIESAPVAFFKVLRSCGALVKIFPELDALFGVPQPAQSHPEIDTGIHSLLSLEQASRLSAKPEVRFAALVHDLGKARSSREHWPRHHGHEQNGLPILDGLCARLRIPKNYQRLAERVIRYHTRCHRAFELRPATLVDMLSELGAFKTGNSLEDVLLACEADCKGRTGLENTPYPQAHYIKSALKAATAIDTAAVLQGNYRGPQIGQAIRRLRIKAIADFIKSL